VSGRASDPPDDGDADIARALDSMVSATADIPDGNERPG
jgi:hypothetical protein